MPNSKQMREYISLVTSQYLSFKDNSEKFNTLVRYMLGLLDIPDLGQ